MKIAIKKADKFVLIIVLYYFEYIGMANKLLCMYVPVVKNRTGMPFRCVPVRRER